MINVSKLYSGLPGDCDELRYSPSDSSGPVVVYNCTGRCNLHCLHCYSSAVSTSSTDELNTTEAKQLLTQLKQINCPVLLFSGGEPLLRSDLFELLAEAYNLGLRTVISTNGTLINAAAAERLARTGVSYVGVSLDGNERFHDKFRQADGAFNSAVDGIKNCQKAGIKTGLRFTITSTNADQVPFIFDFAASSAIKRICFYHLIRTGRAKDLNRQIPTSAQTRRAVDTIIEKTDQFAAKGLLDEVLTVGNHADGPYILLKMAVEKKRNYEDARKLLLLNGGNRTGEKIGCVGPDGSVYPDQFWRNYSLGNVRHKTFRQIWQNPDEPLLSRLRNKSDFAHPRCKNCKWFDCCRGNYRFLGAKADTEYWLNEPACYLDDDQIVNRK